MRGQGNLSQLPKEKQETRCDEDPVKSNRVAVEDPLLLELGLVETDTKGRVPGLQISTPSIRKLRSRFELSVQM